MKTLAILFAFSLYLLLPSPGHSTTSNPIRLPTADVAVAASDGTPVLDISGDEVKAGGAYYIASPGRGAASAEVKLAWLDSSTGKCASDVVLSGPLVTGDPIIITPVDTTTTAVQVSTFQSFRFFVPTSRLCVSSVFWRILYDRKSGQYFLKSGEFDSNISGQFKIEVVDPIYNGYKITYCLIGTDTCYNVSRFWDDSAGVARLVMSDEPAFTVVFRKANV